MSRLTGLADRERHLLAEQPGAVLTAAIAAYLARDAVALLNGKAWCRAAAEVTTGWNRDEWHRLNGFFDGLIYAAIEAASTRADDSEAGRKKKQEE